MSAPDTKEEAAPRANAVQPQNAKMPRKVFFGTDTQADLQDVCKRIEQAFDRIDAICERILSKLEGAR